MARRTPTEPAERSAEVHKSALDSIPLVLDATVTDPRTTGDVLLAVVQHLRQAFGAPQRVPDGVELRCDHAPQFIGHDAAALAERRGIEQTVPPVVRPTGPPVAERNVQTMKVACLWLEDFVDAAHVQAVLDRWRNDAHHERPRSAFD